jgi:uncharacterized protein (DUF1778 family)
MNPHAPHKQAVPDAAAPLSRLTLSARDFDTFMRALSGRWQPNAALADALKSAAAVLRPQ